MPVIFKPIRVHGNSIVRRIAKDAGVSKSSVYRLRQAMDRRNAYPESRFWETDEGQQWLTGLAVAVLYHFCLKRGVGAETNGATCITLIVEPQTGPPPPRRFSGGSFRTSLRRY